MSPKSRMLGEFLLASLFALLLSGCGQATVAPTPTPTGPTVMVLLAKNTALGDVLTDGNGMTLYLYTKDTQGISNCSGTCAQNWPPLIVPAGGIVKAGAGVSATLDTIQRLDGTVQVSVNGMPVYTFNKDKKSGDVTGQGVGGIWFVMDSTGAMVKTELPTAVPTGQ